MHDRSRLAAEHLRIVIETLALGGLAVDRDDHVVGLNPNFFGRSAFDDRFDLELFGRIVDADRETDAAECLRIQTRIELGIFFGAQERRIAIAGRAEQTRNRGVRDVTRRCFCTVLRDGDVDGVLVKARSSLAGLFVACSAGSTGFLMPSCCKQHDDVAARDVERMLRIDVLVILIDELTVTVAQLVALQRGESGCCARGVRADSGCESDGERRNGESTKHGDRDL